MAMADAQEWWGLYDLPVENLELALERSPNHADALGEMAIVAERRERLDESLAWMRRVLSLEPTCAPHYDHIGELLGWLHVRLGEPEKAAPCLRRTEDRARVWIGRGDEGAWPYRMLAIVHVARGDTDGAIRSLERKVERGGFHAWPVHAYRTCPPFDPLCGDPRFEALMERVDGGLERMREAAEADSVMPPPTQPEGGQVPGF